MVGVLIPFTENQNALLLDNPFYAEIVSGIETALRAEGYYMMLSGVGERGAKLDALVELEHGRADRPRRLPARPSTSSSRRAICRRS